MNTTAVEIPASIFNANRRIPASIFNANRRVIETFVPTNRENVFLLIQSYHDKGRKCYRSSLDRVRLERGFVERRINAARFSDLAPVKDQIVVTGRYSAKGLRESFDQFAPVVEDNLEEAIAWAERY